MTETTAIAVGPAKAAPMLDVEVNTLKVWRRRGVGPPYCRVGSRIRYRVTDLEEWLAARTVRPTPKPAAPLRD